MATNEKRLSEEGSLLFLQNDCLVKGMNRKNQVELLAPAGSPDGLYGALRAGADAVYLAGNRFGARAYAENFSTEELVAGIRYSHLLGKRIYLTVNTLLKETELRELYDYLEPFYQAGLDGVILQDLGVLSYIREHFPGMELHASTQMSLCTSYGAALMKELGVCRIVPAREISLEDIRSIKEHVDIEIESFIHGAMCYCYSGQCLFSSILGGRSGNRGRCAQPCRLPYSVHAKSGLVKGHLLSLKDLCTLQNIPALIQAGIDSFKIEGRMKRPEYAAGTVSVYRKAIDSYLELEEKYGCTEAAARFRVDQKDEKLLSNLYIRSQVENGYYFRHNSAEMVTIQSPAYSETQETLLQELSDRFLQEKKKLAVSMEVYLYEGAPAVLSLSCLQTNVTVTGDVVETAQNRPLSEENVRKHLTKLGDTPFALDNFQLQLSESAFVPVGRLNELRRQGIQSLEEALLSARGYGERGAANGSSQPDRDSWRTVSGQYSFSIGVETLSQLECTLQFLQEHPIDDRVALYVNGDLFLSDSFLKQMPVHIDADLFVALPPVLREKEETYLQNMISLKRNHPEIAGFLARTLDEIGFLRRELPECVVHTDANLYCFNSEAARVLNHFADGLCLPYELRLVEQLQLAKSSPLSFEKIVYGRIPMMVTANCIARTTDRCCHEDGRILSLKDRKGKEFPVVTNCIHCYNVIYNSLPTYLPTERSASEQTFVRSIRFTTETDAEVAAVLRGFLFGEAFTLDEYTTGHEKRGVE